MIQIEIPQPGQTWCHYKRQFQDRAGHYVVLHIAEREEDSGYFDIIYQSIIDGSVWTRSLNDWWARIDSPHHQRRFERVIK